MQKIILILAISIISYCFCNSISFTEFPEVINSGELINLQWNYTDSSKYDVEISLCYRNDNDVCQKLIKTTTKFNQVNTTFEFDDPCYFKDKPVENWYLFGVITYSKNNQTHFESKPLKRNLICDDGICKEDACNAILKPENNTEVVPDNNNADVIKNKEIEKEDLKDKDKNMNKKKEFPYLTILFVLTLITLIIVAGFIVYINKFKKKEDDPIPIFSVEDSSYCCDMSVHSPVLGNLSYQSNIIEKSLLNMNKTSNIKQQKASGKNQSSKAADQSHLSIQLHPINPVNDYYSHSSQNSKPRSINADDSFKISQEIQKQNNENNIHSDNSNSGSPYLAALSPISMASSIPFITSTKPIKKKSFKPDNNVKYYRNSESPNIYADPSVIIEKKPNNSYLFSESPMLSDNRSVISNKHSFNSAITDNEEETKVLSSKHYVLSNFEGDYDKEELNLHYGDIVSVINILPEGWAYGELLLKYNSYTKTKMKPIKGSKYRKFGYYPIKCLSLNEESNESNLPSKKIIEQENHGDLNGHEIPSDNDSLNNFNYNNKNKEKFLNKEKSPLLLPTTQSNNSVIKLKSKEVGSSPKTISTKNSKRSSLLNIFKRTSNDFNIANTNITHENENNIKNDKSVSKEIINSDEDSDNETVYHDAEEEEKNSHRTSNFDLKRISVRSSISYRSYM